MNRMISIHELEVLEQQQAEFEQFFADEVANQGIVEGWHFTLLKGERGNRVGQYAVIIEIDSKAARDRYFPEEGVASEEYSQLRRDYPLFFEKFRRLVGSAQRAYTGYWVLIEAEKAGI